MILALLACFGSPKPDLEIDAEGVAIPGERALFPFQPTATRLVLPPEILPLRDLLYQFRAEFFEADRDDYWVKIHPNTHIGWLYRVTGIIGIAHRGSPDGPPLRITDPFWEHRSVEWGCWLVVVDMEQGIPQITPAPAPGLLIRTSRPRRLGVDGQCIQLTPAELPGFLERVPDRCEDVVLEADDLTWKEAKPWFYARSTARLMYPRMRTIWRLREEDSKRWPPGHEPAEYTDWKCENRLDIDELKDPGFSNSAQKTDPRWVQVWNGKPATGD